VFEEALELAQALEGIETPRLQRMQVALIALLLEELRKQRVTVVTPNGKGPKLTPTAVAFMVEDILGVAVEPEKLEVVASLARDEAQLERALQRVKTAEDVKNPIGLLVHILRKWNS